MLMDKLRSGQFVKWVMIVVIATFVGSILFAWGMDLGGDYFNAKSALGKIGKKTIAYSQFNEELANRMRMERRDAEISSFKAASMRDELFQQLVAQTILEKEIKSMDLKGSPEELIQYFRRNPPPGLAQNSYFMKDSAFDTAKYYQFLDSPEAYNIPGMTYLEEYATKFTIPTNQLQILIASSVKTTDLEARDKVLATEEKADVEYLFMPAYAMELPADAVAEKDVQDYYAAHPDSFRTEGMSEVEYAVFPKTPTAEDEGLIKSEMNDLYDRLMKGENFRALAAEFSEDATAKDSGDLGTLSRGAMVKPFEDVAFSMKEGEISRPFRTSFGYHIVKVTSIHRKDSTISAGHILVKVLASPATLDSLREKADTLCARIKGDVRFKALAEKEKLEVRSTGLFEKGGPVPGFEGESRFLPGLKSLAFNSEDKKAEVLENDEAFYIAVLGRRCGEGTAPLDFVRERIKEKLVRERKDAAAKAAMEQMHKSVLAENLTLEQASKRDLRVQYSSQAGASRAAFLPGLGAASRAIYKAFTLKEGEISPVVPCNDGYAVIRLVKKQPLSEEAVNVQLSSTRRSMSDQARYLVYGEWFESKRKPLKVVNNIEMFYPQ